MIFFSSDVELETFYNEFTRQGLKITALVTESPKKQGRQMQIMPNPAQKFAQKVGLSVKYFDSLDKKAAENIKRIIGRDQLGFIFAYGKIIPKHIIDLFENGILNIHFSLLPEYPGASPIQQALLDDKKESGYTVFEITDKLDDGKLLVQEKINILKNDDFDSLRTRIIQAAAKDLPKVLKQYLNWKITLKDLPKQKIEFTHKIKKEDGLINNRDSAKTAYNKIRAYSHWPKTYLIIDGKRLIIHKARMNNSLIEISLIQPEGKKIMPFNQFKNGYQTLLTKMPKFVKIN